MNDLASALLAAAAELADASSGSEFFTAASRSHEPAAVDARRARRERKP
jgi:hypothetical protein